MNNMLPTTKEIEKELERANYKSKYNKLLKSTIYVLVIVISFSIIFATLVFPVLQISGESMLPTLSKDDVVFSIKKNKYKNGDIIAFYYNNKILVKRIIASSSEVVEIDENGNVYVDNVLLKESYILDKSLGETNIEFPYKVPLDTYFVLGDERINSIDSRNTQIGTINADNIIGKILFRIYPLNKFGVIR